MARRISDLVMQRAVESFVGREEELGLLLQSLQDDAPPVVQVYGIGGIGKSSLLEAFASEARGRGATVVRLDCRVIEPTESGFLHELGALVGGHPSSVEEAAHRLDRLGSRVILTLDTYEVFRLMDTWLRQVFIPALSDNVRVIIVGREPPVAAWLATPGWQGLFRSITLGPLTERDSLELLSQAGVGEIEARRINRFVRGHPLALKLAAAAVEERPGLELEEAAVHRVIEELTQLYLADVQDPLTRQALEATSVVRRTTLSLIQTMLPHAAPQDVYERLRTLPFVESGRDGLVIHDTVQQAIAMALKAADPTAYRNYRRAAWRQLRTEVRSVSRQELWRYTADMLFIIENPYVREAFFPSGGQQIVVEAAHPQDAAAIRLIIHRHETPTAAALLDTWWARLPQSFYVARNPHGAVTGFCCIFDPATVDPTYLADDPVTWRWCNHLAGEPVPKNQHVLFFRRWLSMEEGEKLSPEQAAIFLDVKRTYMEQRPHLRRLYASHHEPPAYWSVLRQLTFRWLDEAKVELDGEDYHTIMLDFGPLSVDGWLAKVIAAELGVDEGILDIDARELVFDGHCIPLTRLEFEVMLYLYRREGKVVPRMSLLEEVWGYSYDGGSNVVDSVVRQIRKKLGEHASLVETVSGVGYRFRPS
jgi:hypothetical protein